MRTTLTRRMLRNEEVGLDSFGEARVNLEDKMVAALARRGYFDTLKEKLIDLRVTNLDAIAYNDDGTKDVLGDVVSLKKLSSLFHHNAYTILAVNRAMINAGYRFEALPEGFGTTEGSCFINLRVSDPDRFLDLVSVLDPIAPFGSPSDLVLVSEKTVSERIRIVVNSALEEVLCTCNIRDVRRNQIAIRSRCVDRLNSYPALAGYGLQVVDVHLFFDPSEYDEISGDTDRKILKIEEMDRLEEEIARLEAARARRKAELNAILRKEGL